MARAGLYPMKMVSIGEVLVAVSNSLGEAPDAVEKLFALLQQVTQSHLISPLSPGFDRMVLSAFLGFAVTSSSLRIDQYASRASKAICTPTCAV
jgi:hypothetical protein